MMQFIKRYNGTRIMYRVIHVQYPSASFTVHSKKSKTTPLHPLYRMHSPSVIPVSNIDTVPHPNCSSPLDGVQVFPTLVHPEHSA